MSVRTIDLAVQHAKFLEFAASTDELTPESIKDTLDGIEGQLADKLDSVMSVVRHLEGLADTCGHESKRLAAREKSNKANANKLRAYALECIVMSGVDTIKTATNTFTAANGRKNLVVVDVDSLPDEFVTVESQIVTSPKKDEIKAALNAGQVVPGAHMASGERYLLVR